MSPNNKKQNNKNKDIKATMNRHTIRTDSNSILNYLHQAKWLLKTIALSQTLCFLFVFYTPSVQAAVEELNTSPAPVIIEGNSPEQKLSNALQRIKENIANSKTTVDARMLEENTFIQSLLAFFGLSSLTQESLNSIESLNTQIQTFHQSTLANFAEVEALIQSKQLDASIKQRHQDTVAQYQQRYNELQQHLQNALNADSLQQQQSALDDVHQFLVQQQFKRKQQSFDPNDLPNKTQKANPNNTPKTTSNDFIQSGLSNSPKITLAALGDFKYDQLQEADNPAYLATSDEITQSQVIKDKAQELEYNAVNIYHYVRNSIEWQPGWGGVQNADLTLSAQRGNAMDIASLTIALLRASQIPARYVHGTIEVSAEHYNNWMGGFNSLQAAAGYASSNGIPTTAVTSAGNIQKIHMEHVWVEVATDYYPSRGAVNTSADRWLALDPSYKQYTYQQGLDVASISGLDTDQLAQDFIDSGTSNTAESWSSGFDASILQNAQSQIQNSLESHITNNLTNPSVIDIIGGKKTIIKDYPTLPSGLSTKIIAKGVHYDKLPTQLQQSVSWGLGTDIFGQAKNPITLPFATVNNEKITLSFTPATQADQQTLEALIPEGDITDINQLPSSIPSYLIKVIPQLKLNGNIIKTGNAMNLGQEIDLVTDIKVIGRPNYHNTYSVIAGSYLAVNAYAQNISNQQLTDLQQRLDNSKTKLESNDDAQLATLTRQELLGDLFHAGGLGYYTQLTALSQFMGLQSGNHQNLIAGMGTIGYEPNVDTFFGIPRAITTGGIIFDIPIITATANNDGNQEQRKQYQIQTGMLSSALEHATPEQMFATDDPNEPAPNAVSAVKALQIASQAGQRIYHITKDNQAATLPNINHSSETLREIQSAINSGKEVTTHTDSISVPGWTGAGYIIIDPITGEGAYKISGGSNGGFFDPVIDKLQKFLDFLSLGVIEDVIGLFGSAAAKLLFTVKGKIEQILNLLKIGIECDLKTAIGIYLSISFITIGFSGLTVGLLLVNPLLALTSAVAGTALVGAVIENTLEGCK